MASNEGGHLGLSKGVVTGLVNVRGLRLKIVEQINSF